MIQLLSGIPRSGTTLCCKLLNQVEYTVALHEPLDPQKLKSTSRDIACAEVSGAIHALRTNLIKGVEFEHGDQSGIELDNPVSLSYSEHGIRPLSAQRGLLSLPKQNSDFHLIVKQNALFAALAPQLSLQYSMVALVRNPIKVLLSWMSVDLPVNKGRVPAGERFSKSLTEKLSQKSEVLEKQLVIYKWFIQQYQQANLPVVKYEDVIASDGEALFAAFDIHNGPLGVLQEPNRQISALLVQRLRANIEHIATSLVSDYYSLQNIQDEYERVMKGII